MNRHRFELNLCVGAPLLNLNQDEAAPVAKPESQKEHDETRFKSYSIYWAQPDDSKAPHTPYLLFVTGIRVHLTPKDKEAKKGCRVIFELGTYGVKHGKQAITHMLAPHRGPHMEYRQVGSFAW